MIFNPFNLICHRLPERTFKIRGHYFPVCSRCTGFYISLFLYYVYTFFFFVEYNNNLIILALLLLIPALIDGSTQLLDLRESNNYLRLATGILGGLGLGIIIKAIKWAIFIM